MATIEWMRSYPDDAESYVVIATSYKTSSEIIAFYEIGRNVFLPILIIIMVTTTMVLARKMACNRANDCPCDLSFDRYNRS